MAKVETMSESERSFVERMTTRRASGQELGRLHALHLSVVDAGDRRTIEEALRFQSAEREKEKQREKVEGMPSMLGGSR